MGASRGYRTVRSARFASNTEHVLGVVSRSSASRFVSPPVFTRFHVLGFLFSRTEIVVILFEYCRAHPRVRWRFGVLFRSGDRPICHMAYGPWRLRPFVEVRFASKFFVDACVVGIPSRERGVSDQFRCVQRKVRLLVSCSP